MSYATTSLKENELQNHQCSVFCGICCFDSSYSFLEISSKLYLHINYITSRYNLAFELIWLKATSAWGSSPLLLKTKLTALQERPRKLSIILYSRNVFNLIQIVAPIITKTNGVDVAKTYGTGT